MVLQRAAASAVVNARADRVYGILRDYRDGHPRILPPRNFPMLQIETGGVGAGTVLRVEVRLLGAIKKFHLTVTEPEPGRVLVETDASAATVTTFTVDPGPSRGQSRVTIATEWPGRGGILGAVERLVAPRAMRNLFTRELVNLAALAEGGADGTATGR